MKTKPRISLPTFVDFVCASGVAKITKVRTARDRYGAPYQPATDYYKGLRETLTDVIRNGTGSPGLKGFVSSVHEKKVQHYKACVAGFRRFLRRHSVAHAGDVAPIYWSHAGLDVKVNPELLVTVDGTPTVIKLYFKEDPLSTQRIQTILQLLHETHGKIAVAAVLDVRRGVLHRFKSIPGVAHLLRGEASSFATIWEGFDASAA